MYGQLFACGNEDVPLKTGPQYNTIAGQNDMPWSSTEDDAQLIVPTAGKFGKLVVRGTVAPGAAKSWTFTLRKNGANTALTVTMSGAGTPQVRDLTHWVHFNAGDLVSLQSDSAGTPASSPFFWGMVFIPDDGQSFIMMSSSLDGNMVTNRFLPPHGPNALGETAENSCYLVSPMSFEVTDIYFRCNVAPGVGNSRTVEIFQNNVGTGTGVVTISNAATTGSISSPGVIVAENDLLTIKHTTSGSPATSKIKVSLAYLPSRQGEFIVAGATPDDLATSTTIRFNFPFLGSGPWLNNTAIGVGNYFNNMSYFTKLKTRWEVAPGVGNTRTMEMVRFGSGLSPNWQTVVSGTNQIGTYTSSIYPNLDQESFSVIQTSFTGTPATSKVSWSLVGRYIYPLANNLVVG